MSNRHIVDEPTADPWKYLTIGIIHQALLDLRQVRKHGKIYANSTWIYSDEDEIMSFFQSPWFEQLLVWTDVTPEQVQAAIDKAI